MMAVTVLKRSLLTVVPCTRKRGTESGPGQGRTTAWPWPASIGLPHFTISLLFARAPADFPF